MNFSKGCGLPDEHLVIYDKGAESITIDDHNNCHKQHRKFNYLTKCFFILFVYLCFRDDREIR